MTLAKGHQRMWCNKCKAPRTFVDKKGASTVRICTVCGSEANFNDGWMKEAKK